MKPEDIKDPYWFFRFEVSHPVTALAFWGGFPVSWALSALPFNPFERWSWFQGVWIAVFVIVLANMIIRKITFHWPGFNARWSRALNEAGKRKVGDE